MAHTDVSRLGNAVEPAVSSPTVDFYSQLQRAFKHLKFLNCELGLNSR